MIGRKQLLLLLDALLIVAIVALGVRLYRVWAEAPPGPSTGRPPATTLTDSSPAPAAAPAPAPALSPQSDVTGVAERNIMSPTRSETPPEPPKPTPSTRAAAQRVKPFLHGVVLSGDDGARAFLQDPRTRRVSSYGIGDSVGDSRVEKIGADRVVLRQGDDVFEVLLRDPAKPKPPPAPPAPVISAAPPGAAPPPGLTGAAGLPPGVPGAAARRGARTAPPGQAPGVVPGAEEAPSSSQPQPYAPAQPGVPGVPVLPGMPLPPDLPSASSP